MSTKFRGQAQASQLSSPGREFPSPPSVIRRLFSQIATRNSYRKLPSISPQPWKGSTPPHWPAAGKLAGWLRRMSSGSLTLPNSKEDGAMVDQTRSQSLTMTATIPLPHPLAPVSGLSPMRGWRGRSMARGRPPYIRGGACVVTLFMTEGGGELRRLVRRPGQATRRGWSRTRRRKHGRG